MTRETHTDASGADGASVPREIMINQYGEAVHCESDSPLLATLSWCSHRDPLETKLDRSEAAR